jgi:C4-dicarboxylate-specific signal transduction histidine kinase
MIKLKNIIKKNHYTLGKGATLSDAVALMNTNRSGVVVIVEEGKVLGVLTERDIIAILNLKKNLSDPAIDYATKGVIAINKNRDVEYALNVLIDNNIRRLVITDDENTFVTVIVQETILHYIEKDSYRVDLKISNILNREHHMIHLTKEKTMLDAISVMNEKKIGSVIIMEADKIVGIVTERDTIKLLCSHTSLDTPLEQVMAQQVITVSEDESITSTIRLMEDSHIRRVVVVDKDQKPISIVGTRDILRNLKGSYGAFLEKKLASSQMVLNSINSSILLIYQCEEEYIIQWANNKAKETFGFSCLDVDITNIIDAQQWNSILERLERHNTIEKERIVYKNRKFDAMFNNEKYHNLKSIRILLKDVTDYERKIEKEVQKRLEQQALFTQQSKLALMGEMIGMIAHQWKQPLSIVSILADDIEDQTGSQKGTIKKHAKTIQEQVAYMNTTMENFLGFFKPNKQTECIDVGQSIDKGLAIVQAKTKINRIAIKRDFIDTPITHTYQNELIQVVLNILNNAIDALIENRIENPTITITLYEKDNKIHIKIHDNGGGIPEEIYTTLYEPFISTKEEQGTGLGLYMVKLLTEDKLGGRVSVENIKEGACFTVILDHV